MITTFSQRFLGNSSVLDLRSITIATFERVFSMRCFLICIIFWWHLYYFSSNLLLFAIIIVVAENGVLYQFFSFSNTFKYLWKCIEYLFIKQRIYWSSMAQASISIWDFSSKEKSFSIHRCRWMLLVLFLIFFF